MVNVRVQHSDLYKLPKSKLTNANIPCLVRFGSGRNKLVQLLIRSWNSGVRTVRSLIITITDKRQPHNELTLLSSPSWSTALSTINFITIFLVFIILLITCCTYRQAIADILVPPKLITATFINYKHTHSADDTTRQTQYTCHRSYLSRLSSAGHRCYEALKIFKR